MIARVSWPSDKFAWGCNPAKRRRGKEAMGGHMLCRSRGDVEDIFGSEIYRTQGPGDEKPTDTKVTLVEVTEEV